MTERILSACFKRPNPHPPPERTGSGVVHLQGIGHETGGANLGGQRAGWGCRLFHHRAHILAPNLIAPALRSERPPDGPMTLVAAELGSRTGWLSDQLRSEHSHAVRALIQNCLHSDLDLLLPRMGASGAAELFFIVVLTDAVGGEAIAKRIREQLSSSTYLQQAGLTLSTWYQPLDPDQ